MTTKTKKTKTVAEAIWTPWGEVLCAACNNDRVGQNSTAKTLPKSSVTVARSVDHLGVCDDCLRPVGRENASDVMALQNVARRIGGQLQQTGGMCCAAVADLEDGGKVVVTRDEVYCVGVYAPDAWEDTGDVKRSWLLKSHREAVKTALNVIELSNAVEVSKVIPTNVESSCDCGTRRETTPILALVTALDGEPCKKCWQWYDQRKASR